MNKHFGEASVVGLIFVFIPQMPFTEDAGFIAVLRQQLRKGCRGQRHALALKDRMGHAVSKFVPSTENRGARRRAGWTHMELPESCGLFVELVQIWRLQDRIAHAGEIAHPLIVGHDQNDARF